MSLAPRVVIVHRTTEYEELVAHHGTHGQAAFFLSSRGRDIEEIAERHRRTRRALTEVTSAIPLTWRQSRVERADLDRFLFAPEDVVVVVGQDGLVANVAKYLAGQPVVGIDSDPGRNPGVLVRHRPADAGRLLPAAFATATGVDELTMVEAVADDTQRLLALNEIYLGAAGHQTARYRLGVEGDGGDGGGDEATTGAGAADGGGGVASGGHVAGGGSADGGGHGADAGGLAGRGRVAGAGAADGGDRVTGAGGLADRRRMAGAGRVAGTGAADGGGHGPGAGGQADRGRVAGAGLVAGADAADGRSRVTGASGLSGRGRVAGAGGVAGAAAADALAGAGGGEVQASSGVLVGTGTGATGWIRSVWEERGGPLPLPRPTEDGLVWFVREAWPSPATGTSRVAGRLSATSRLTLTVESERLIAFGDGMEGDALELTWGQVVRVGICGRRLRLVG